MIRLCETLSPSLWLSPTYGVPTRIAPPKLPPLFAQDVVGHLQVLGVGVDVDAAALVVKFG